MQYKNVSSWGATDKYLFRLAALGDVFFGYPFETPEQAAFCSDLCKRILTDGFGLKLDKRVKLSLSEDSFVQFCLAEGLDPTHPQGFMMYPKLPDKFREFVTRNRDAWQAAIHAGRDRAGFRGLILSIEKDLAEFTSRTKARIDSLRKLEAECLGASESVPAQPATLQAVDSPRSAELPPPELGYFVS